MFGRLGEPLNSTVEPGTKLDPVRSKNPPGGMVQGVVVPGVIEASLGPGFDAGPTGRPTDGDAIPGVVVCTAMLAREVALKFSAPIVAVSMTGVPDAVVVNCVPLNVIWSPETKLSPLTVIMTFDAVPATTLAGEIDVIAGPSADGGLIRNDKAF